VSGAVPKLLDAIHLAMVSRVLSTAAGTMMDCCCVDDNFFFWEDRRLLRDSLGLCFLHSSMLEGESCGFIFSVVHVWFCMALQDELAGG
jgi:hypothetical protein